LRWLLTALALAISTPAFADGSASVSPVTLGAPSLVAHFNLQLGERETRAKPKLFASGTGTSAPSTGNGRLKMILRGPWYPAQL
jgi:hypothetical protein